MHPSLPQTRDLVLIGGGHSHALVLRRWGMAPLPGVRLTLINPDPVATYSGMLPGHVAGHYALDDLSLDLVRLARFAGARLILGAAGGIDPVARTVQVAGRPAVAFDLASVNVGVTSALPALPGFAAHGVPAKPLGDFARAWAALRDRPDPPPVVVIGGGIAGVELVLAMAHALGGRARGLTLLDRAAALGAAAPRTRALLRAALAAAGVRVIESVEVVQVTADAVHLADGRAVPSGFTVGAAGAQPPAWLEATGLALHDGFLAVDPMLRTSDPAILAAGDCVHLSRDPRPKAGVFAVRQAPVLFDNLRAALTGGRLRPYRPQRDYLKLVSLGDRRALAEKWGTALAAPALWRWKDRIDRRFMAQFHDLPVMAPPALPKTVALGVAQEMAADPPCAGCGAKVGRAPLARALATLPPGLRADVRAPPGGDAAILTLGGASQIVTVDQLSGVTEDPVLLARLTAIHALGDVWAMGAQPQAALVSLTLPRLSGALQERTLAEVMQTLAEVLGAAGAALAGGHTATGEVLTIGLTLTGLPGALPLSQAGGRSGDALILTRPLGSGTILAAEMRRLARGQDVAACWDRMAQPQAQAAALLGGAHAMTDVTGFGLAGHLANICAASGTGARLNLDALPLMPGALDLAAAGVRSSLWQANREGAGPVFGATGPRGALIFDPQTCGGLLAAVDARQAGALLARLRAAGYPAAQVGVLTPGPGPILCD